MLWRTVVGTVVAVLGATLGSPANAQGPMSAGVAAEVAALMTQQRLDVFAVQDPEGPNRFLAVMLIPNVQLLVVSAEYPAPAELTAQLTRKNYREVYTALHQPASAPTRFFLLDPGCDGLGGDRDTVDVLYEKGITQTLFNGDWKSQALSEGAYQSKLKEAERQYSQILSRLVDALRASPKV
jgi:hypothetical protein